DSLRLLPRCLDTSSTPKRSPYDPNDPTLAVFGPRSWLLGTCVAFQTRASLHLLGLARSPRLADPQLADPRDTLPSAFIMRIRKSFAGVFLLQLLLAGYAGLSSLQLGQYVNDKVLHLLIFFSLTVNFYWIFDTTRRRIINMTLVVVTIVLGAGSEAMQGALPNGRNFDVYDIVANLVGSLAGLGLCSLYHKRMLERRRQKKGYGALPGDEDADIELGQGQQTGLTAGPSRARTEVDDWAEGGPPEASAPATAKGKEPEAPDAAEPKKRTD
ncbi:Uncharacterized protein TPAR_03905, partial [Tolypocladium paradoxum]